MAESINMDLEVPEINDNGVRKVTKVRKGMGQAKYSTLITTIPAEMCKNLNINSGDSLVWNMNPKNRVLTVIRMDPLLTKHGTVVYDILDQLQNSNIPKEEKENVAKVRELLKEMGTHGLDQLSPEKRKEKLQKFVTDHKAKKDKKD